MKKYLIILLCSLAVNSVCAQNTVNIVEGHCKNGLFWRYDGYTLSFTNNSKLDKNGKKPKIGIPDYNLKDKAPWLKKQLNINKVIIGTGIDRIGSCAFYDCPSLTDVEFKSNAISEIGWGAFLNCSSLRNISLPIGLKKIGIAAFANCKSITSIAIPDQCRVEDMAFMSCDKISQISISQSSIIGFYSFATEVEENGVVSHKMSDAVIKYLPSYINETNCSQYGLSKESVSNYYSENNIINNEDYYKATSDVDSLIPRATLTNSNAYALVIGNQHYRYAPNVPYALHDAKIFAEYCNKTLGIPTENIHLCENATKSMILEDELVWISNIPEKRNKTVYIYYAGHGMPGENNKAFLLPTDIRGTKPENGISLNDLYDRLGEMPFYQTRVFLDACFSGLNRDAENVNEGLRGVEIDVEESEVNKGNIVVFSASQGNETAQGYTEQGHGLFTYFLLKAIKDSYGTISLGNLSDEIYGNVTRTASGLRLRKMQTPTTKASETVSDTWRKSRL